MSLPGLLVSRISRVNKECVHALRVASLCIVAQGAKTVIVGDQVYEYDSSRMIVFSVALPVAAQVTQATPAHPYLSLRLALDPLKIAELVLKVYPRGLPALQDNPHPPSLQLHRRSRRANGLCRIQRVPRGKGDFLAA